MKTVEQLNKEFFERERAAYDERMKQALEAEAAAKAQPENGENQTEGNE